MVMMNGRVGWRYHLATEAATTGTILKTSDLSDNLLRWRRYGHSYHIARKYNGEWIPAEHQF
jgi:hypothetical protein